MLHDYHVPFIREEDIALAASKWRSAGGISNRGFFNIVEFIEGTLSRRLARKKGNLVISQSNLPPDLYPAYVTFEPTTLHVDSEVWEFARLGAPEERFYVAHEIGHILLHNHHAKAFSNDTAKYIRFAINETSAEWQANTFAGYFLLPDHIVEVYTDERELCTSCGVPTKLARYRRSNIDRLRYKLRKFTGDSCPRCAEFTILHDGTILKCDNCGAIVGRD